MKTISKYVSVLLVIALSFASCDEWMNAVPEGGTKTADQVEEAAQLNPATAAADLSGIYAQFIALYGGLGDLGYERHNDYGYASICLFMDEQGQDLVSPNIGYNWFQFADFPNNRDNTLTTTRGLVNHLVWGEYYKIIYACNNVINMVDRDKPGVQKYALSQALAIRAMCYMNLAQLFQYTYATTDKKATTVPLVLDRMPAEKVTNNPRATLEELFALCTEDLNYACDSLEGYNRPDNGFVNQAVAFGLRARLNLVKGQWEAAANDADQALKLSGAKPLSIAEANEPGFADGAAHNVLWANIIVVTNDVVLTGIINWPSHMSIFFQDGYTSVGATRSIASALYNEISATDVRKGWWLDENLESPLLDAAGYNAVKADIQGSADNVYTNVKFGTGDRSNTGDGAAAADWIIMRAEEMYLIKAEGLARAGKDGKSVLIDFVKQYRDPNYTVADHNLSLEDEIWWQRRVELWGEGFAWGDIMRLEKPIVRTNSKNFPEAWKFDVPARHGVLLWRIPQSEIEANEGISEADNNPYVPFP